MTRSQKKEADQLRTKLSLVIKTKRKYSLEELYTLMNNHLVEQFGTMLLEEKERLFKLNAKEGLRSILVKSAVAGVALEIHPIGKGIHISQTYDKERVNALYGVLSEKEKLTVGDVVGGATSVIAYLAADNAMGCLGAIPGINIIVRIIQYSKLIKQQREFHLATKDNAPLIASLRDEITKIISA